jgi:DNA-directed RNA polymerase specialized sigma24 family protein
MFVEIRSLDDRGCAAGSILSVVPGIRGRKGYVRTISSVGLGKLLARLDGDAEQRGNAYERLRRGLIRFFDWRGAPAPDACADETIDRLARKLEAGTTIDDVDGYALGVARMVLLEQRRAPAMMPLDEHAHFAIAQPGSTGDVDRRADCLDRCLGELPFEARSLVLEYYAGDRSAKIANRRRLAGELRLTENALRSRVQRLRERLERCVHACVEAIVR